MSLYCPHCFSQNPEGMTLCRHCGKTLYVSCQVNQLPPMTILDGRYLVGVVLGSGGFGITYAGFDLRLKKRVAIKEYYPGGLCNRISSYSFRVEPVSMNAANIMKIGREKFLKEAQTISHFNHLPTVVDVSDYFETNGTAYIVMEYLDGVSMSAWLKQHGPEQDFNNLYAMLAPVLRDLEQIHREGVIHRDISPSNLMLLEDGTVKLLDFGTAREMSEEGEESLSVVLKHGFAPAEQYSRRGQQGAWTDIYALCATMYKLLTGLTPDAAMDRQEEDRLKPPSQLGVNINSKQEQTLLRGLAVRKADRIQTLAELMAGFDERTVIDSDPPPPPPPPPWLWIIGAMAIMIVAVLLVLLVLTAQLPDRGAVSAAVSTNAPVTLETSPPTPEPARDPQQLAYEEAEALLAEGKMFHAIAAFRALGDYRDAAERTVQLSYASGMWNTFDTCNWQTVGILPDNTVIATEITGGTYFNQCEVYDWTDIVDVSAFGGHTVGLRSDGTVVACGGGFNNELNVSDWTDIVDVIADNYSTYGLRADGTVINQYGRYSEPEWTDVIAIESCYGGLSGLRKDGTVVCTDQELQSQLQSWTDIVAIAAKSDHIVGLRSDGTVVDNYDGECEVSDWRDIVAIAAGYDHTVGLRSDGTVVAAGRNYDGECEVSDWRDIVTIASTAGFTVGVRKDGTVVCTDQELHSQLQSWTDIVAVSLHSDDPDRIIGLRSDGKVLAIMANVDHWPNILVPGK